MMNTRIIYLLLLAMFVSNFSIAQRRKEREKEEGKEILARFTHEVNMTKDPRLGYVPKDRLVEAYNQRKVRLENIAARSLLFSWTERGPNSDAVGSSNGNSRPGNGITSGRMRAIWEDKSDATGKTVWVGGIDGGLWKTNDITATPATWTPINDYLGNLSIASISQDPTNFNIMYFGTGEKADNADAVRGAGIWMSTDHGVNWNVMNGTSGFWKISKVVCDASGNLYVACSSGSGNPGLQRYTKATAVWDNITPTGLSPRIADIELSSTGRLHVVCGYRNTPGGHRYTDNPATVTSGSWTSPVSSYTNVGINTVLASSGNTIYALPSNANYEVAIIYKSTDGGANWSATGSTPSFTSGQSWYCIAAAVDPNNANNVIVGSLDCYKTTNGGTSWTKISNWVGTTGQYVHADQQIITWRSNNQVLVGCDGGIHYSPNGGTNFYDKNTGLRIKQFYSVAVHPSSTNYFLAGAQDNGTHQLNSPGLGSSVEVTGGDGAFVHIDQNQPQYQWGAYVYNQYRRSTNSGSSWSSVNFSGSTGRFINPTDYDDANNIMYCSNSANTYLRWNDAQTGSSFTSVAIGLNGGTVSAVKVSPYTSNTVFFAGGGSGVIPSLYKAVNANATPTLTNIISASMQISSANISSIEFGSDENNIIVAFSNYGINNLWVTNDGGANWTTIDGDLPDMPVRWAMFHPDNNSKAIIATETGVWQTELINGAATVWDPETGFPNVRTDMLQYRSSDRLLAASTHGRGIFTTTIAVAPSCGTVAGLTSSSITTSSATVSWSLLSGANNYDIDYKEASSGTWINAATASVSTLVNLSGLTAGTLYDWRVRGNCTGSSGSYAQAQFTTTALPSCGNVTGLSSSAITTSSATVSWSALGGAGNYDVDYKEASSGIWINAATNSASTSLNLGGLTLSTLYDWRVRANCTNGLTGNYTQAQFTTITPTCGTVTGLSSSAITVSSATISWSALGGAGNYDADYKEASSGTWINAATGSVSTSANLGGLTASTLYDWRVRANCTNGITGSYSQSQFTSAAPPTCGNVTGLSSSVITSSAATVSWSALSGAGNYDVDYKISSSGIWTNAVTATSSLSVNLGGLTASTLYDWRVRANCSNGVTGNYSQAQFTTAAPGCPDILEPNNTLATAAPISTFTNYNALIAANGDNDYYSFSNTQSAKRIRVTLSNLPANYDLTLYKPNGSKATSAAHNGTVSEVLIYNVNKANQVGIYKVYVFGKSGAFNATQCYTLLVELGATNFGNELPPDDDELPTNANFETEIVKQGGLKLYPVPASGTVTASFDANGKGVAEFMILDRLGAVVLKKQAGVDKGINYYTLDISQLPAGVYSVKVSLNNDVKVQKLIIQK